MPLLSEEKKDRQMSLQFGTSRRLLVSTTSQNLIIDQVSKDKSTIRNINLDKYRHS